jgi:hypothetical protein
MFFLLFHLLTFTSYAQDPVTSQIEDTTQELMKIRQEQQKAYDSIMKNFSLSNPFGTENSSQIERIRNFFNKPTVRALYRFFSSPQFMQAGGKIVQHPHKVYIFYAELTLFLFLALYRAWRTSLIPKSSWLRTLWLHLYTSVLYLGLAVTIIPWMVFGEPYRQILFELFQVLRTL